MAHNTLHEVFGFSHFRHAQQQIIESVLSQHNTLAIMPTGGGKSLCYQIPALVLDGITVVISPLISLMHDQVRQLEQLGVSAVMLNSALSTDAYQRNIHAIESGAAKLVFLAPETVLQQRTLSCLQQITVSCIAIDEAHCISEWGHEFRPEYRQLSQLLMHFPKAVCIALTATATPRVREDIKRQLSIAAPNEFMASFDRPNLYIEVQAKEDPYAQTTQFIRQHPEQSGIIYCQSRAMVDELSSKLLQDGFSVSGYHAGISSDKRAQVQDDFVRDNIQIMVATVAFGMGINKPDVRYVLHYDLPKNIESYYQQIGRGGRDGENANCMLLFGYGDIGKIRYFIDNMQNEQEARLANQHLQHMLSLAESELCRRVPLLQYFGEEPEHQQCSMCDNCLNEPQQKQDLTVAAQKFLSCVHRTGQRFGAGYIVDVLRGSNAEKILQNQHNLLSTYNIGGEYSKKQWMTLARKLVQQQLVAPKDQYGGLQLTEKAAEVLRGNVQFYALLANETKVSAGKNTKDHSANLSVNQVLLQQLKTLRKQLADTENAPPYAIFSDRSLQEMAHFYPQSASSLMQIHGVGKAKLDAFGETVLATILTFCEQHNIAEISNNALAKTPTGGSKKENEVGKKTIQMVQQFEEGYTAEALAHMHKVKINTVFGHLLKYVQQGHVLTNLPHLLMQINVDDATIDKALQACDNIGVERLKPLYEQLQERVSYEQWHLIRVYYLAKKGLSKAST